MMNVRATDVPVSKLLDIDAPLGPLGDMSPAVLRENLHRMADWAADYRENIERLPIAPMVSPGDTTRLTTSSVPENAEPMNRILGDLDAVVMPGILHWGHPKFVAYFGSTSNGPALLGEIAAAALNVSAMTWRTSPAATELEMVVLDWIRQMVGLPESFTGLVYDTASTGVLHAMAAAREGKGGDIRGRGMFGRNDLPRYRLYSSDQAHSSLEKAAIVLGFGEENVVHVPCDNSFRLDVSALRNAIDTDIRDGFVPLAVVATVGTTSTASIDPVAAISEVCREHDVWLHIDAAYGGPFAILQEGRYAFDGAEHADSIVLNPHKWLFVPLDFSTLYVRKPDLLREVFSLTREYLKLDASGGAINYMDYGYQLGRRFRALKAWMTFRAFGRSGIESRIRENCRLAAHFARLVSGNPLFELAAPQLMGVVAFRFLPELADGAKIDRLNEEIVQKVNDSGRAYITHTRLNGLVAMRIGVGNLLTEERHLDDVWSRIIAAAGELADA
ncbi:MAG: pyridoxal-dependent decarboxylase [Gemmatimonadaceae bacterium]